MKFLIRAAIAVAGVYGAFASPAASAAPNWASVPAKDVMLFYPGQSSWEWVLTQTDHSGATKFRDGKNCAACHVGDEKSMGDILVSGKTNESHPIAGKPGSIDAKVQIAHDDKNLYVRLVFAEGNQPNAKMDATDTRVTMMLGGGVPEFTRAGCFGACHDDSTGMPSAGTSDRTMYLGKTRAKLTRQGGGDSLKPASDLAALKSGGYVLEYWQAKLNPGAPASAENGTIFDKREKTSPVVSADASDSAGTWSVTLTRKLDAGAIPLVAGNRYTIAFAIHAGHTNKRFHYVSFERSLVLDEGSADFIARNS